MAQKNEGVVEIFYSYAHKDENLLARLEIHLASLKNLGIITGWHDRDIEAGEEWEGKIDEHLNTARVILLLVSADFLASRYCYDVEVALAIERHEAETARVIPIILKPCDWQGTPLGHLQALPKNGKPVTTWVHRDQAFTDIVLGIKAAVAQIQRISLVEATKKPPTYLQQPHPTRQPKQTPLTIAITGSTWLPQRRVIERVQETVSVYLNSQTLWYCGSVGVADATAVKLLLEEQQQVVVVGYDAYDISDEIRVLLETYQVPFVDPVPEELPIIPGAPLLFESRSRNLGLGWPE